MAVAKVTIPECEMQNTGEQIGVEIPRAGELYFSYAQARRFANKLLKTIERKPKMVTSRSMRAGSKKGD
jgi:hypothetical protein